MSQTPDNPTINAGLSARLAQHGRWWLMAGGALFVISSAFPVVAALVPAENLPAWIGILDVVLAFALVLVMMIVDAAARGWVDAPAQQMSYRACRLLAHLLLLFLILFFVVGDQIRWNVLLPGLAWRAWVLIYVLPSGTALFRMTKPAA